MKLEEYIDRLSGLSADSDGYVIEFEGVLAEILDLKDASCIGLLLPFFDDDAEYDELMFSIIHTIEFFDDSDYVRELIDGLPGLWEQSKQWAIVLHMRILNSSTVLEAYLKALSTASDSSKEVFQEILIRIAQERTKFAQQCEEILTQIKTKD